MSLLSGDFLTIYVDGGVYPNPGEAGYGIVFIEPDATETCFMGYIPKATNNEAEIIGILQALHIARNKFRQYKLIKIYSDSNYAINILSGKWNINVINKVPKLLKIYRRMEKSFGWIGFYKAEAHSGDKYNTMANRMANAARTIPEIKIPQLVDYYTVKKVGKRN